MTPHYTKSYKNIFFQMEYISKERKIHLLKRWCIKIKWKNLLERKSPKYVQTPHTTYIVWRVRTYLYIYSITNDDFLNACLSKVEIMQLARDCSSIRIFRSNAFFSLKYEVYNFFGQPPKLQIVCQKLLSAHILAWRLRRSTLIPYNIEQWYFG